MQLTDQKKQKKSNSVPIPIEIENSSSLGTVLSLSEDGRAQIMTESVLTDLGSLNDLDNETTNGGVAVDNSQLDFNILVSDTSTTTSDSG